MATNSNAQNVRNYLNKHPKASAKEVALKFNVSPAYVYVLRSQLKKASNAKAAPGAEATLEVAVAPVVEPTGDVAPQGYLMDLINNPPHYTDGGIEVIDFIEAKRLDYHLGSVVAYVSRAGKKDDELADLQKAQWYLNRAIERRQIATSVKAITASAANA